MQRTHSVSQDQKLQNLDGLRGLMAIWVVAGHATTLAAIPLSPHGGIGRFVANGSFAVDVFIILSGFVISLLLARQKERYGDFLLRRAFRLFPVYWVALVLSIVILPLSVQFLQSLPWIHEHNAVRLEIFEKTLDHFWAHLAPHALLLHGIIPESVLPATGTAFIGQAWSLTLEWQFYLVSPLVLLLAKAPARRIGWVLAAIAVTYAGAAMLQQPSFLLTKLHLFVAGMISQQLVQDLFEKRSTAAVFVRNLSLLGLLFVTQKALVVPWLIWMTALCSQVLPKPSGLFLDLAGRILSHPVACWLGRISYPVYCLHMVVLYCCGYALVNILGVQSHIVYASTLLIGGFVLTLVLARLVNRSVEEPMIALGKRLVARLRPKSDTAAATTPLALDGAAKVVR